MSGTTFEPTPATKARGELIRNAREAKGMAQGALAAEIGVSRVSVSYYETGQVDEISLRAAHRLHEVLGIPLHFLLTEAQRMIASSMRQVAETVNKYDGVLWESGKRGLTDEALTLAAQYDALKANDPAKQLAKKTIEDAFKAARPNYAKWEDELAHDPNGGRKRKKKLTTK